MARRVARRVIVDGCVFAFLPDSCTVATLDPKAGGVGSARQSLEFAAQWLTQVTAPGGAVVGEDALARPSDPVLQAEHDPWFAVGEEVYLYLRFPTSQEDLERLLAKTSALRQIVMVARPTPDDLDALGGGAVAPEVCDRVGDNVEAVIVGAFDGDGYLCWTQDRSL
jgi:hypothetical protein